VTSLLISIILETRLAGSELIVPLSFFWAGLELSIKRPSTSMKAISAIDDSFLAGSTEISLASGPESI